MTTLFNNADISTTPIDAPLPRKKHTWLPLLTVLFCLSYGLMTMLIVEQGATIESQRVLIRELFRDSTALSAFKRAQQGKTLAGGQCASSPKAQAPVTQNPSSHTPSSQAAPRRQTQQQKPQNQMPSRPAADWGDNRRALITI